MRSPNWLVNATHAVRLISVVFLSTLFVGCGTTEVARDKFYPADWPEIVGAADDCRGIEGTFENKGVLVDEKGQRREHRFTDLWQAAVFKTPMELELEGLRACERVRLTIESFTYRATFSDEKAWRLILAPCREITRDSQVLFEPCTEIRLPVDKPYPFNQEGREPNIIAYCMKRSLQVGLNWGTGGLAWLLGLASDGSLLVRLESAQLLGIAPVIWPTTEAAWARFNRVP
jgi:hypothetical protein